VHDAIAEVELLVQDASVDGGPEIGGGRGQRETKRLLIPAARNDRFLDGPACRRIAVVDFDPATGAPAPPPARFAPAAPDRPLAGRYTYDGGPTSAGSLAINAFGTVFLTVRMFEGRDALGREVPWAFNGEQLLVVPRAGEWANAFYDRDTRSLQFFSFPSPSGDTVHTALSRDIVAHECGHALLDAVVPSLHDSSTPESVAIHESVADLVALLMALDSDGLRTSVLERSGNSLSGANPFTGIAEEFGLARPGPGGVTRRALRELDHRKTVQDLVDARPHVLSTLLSAIFYETLTAVFSAQFDAFRAGTTERSGTLSPAAAANKALGTAHLILRRLLLRAIDYLPPGDLTFADVGRATLAADRAVLADARAPERVLGRRRRLSAAFVDRGVVASAEALDGPAPRALDLDPRRVVEVRDSDFAAYQYVTGHRDLLGIPAGAPFTVLPRVDATKVTGPRRDGRAPEQRELLVKIAWTGVEEGGVPVAGARQRQVPTGATVALLWADGRCLALVRSDVLSPRHREARDTLVKELAGEGLLDGDAGIGVRVMAGMSTLYGTHRLLHLLENG
jgi:hypothetical protein